jgi:hypothetical protein
MTTPGSWDGWDGQGDGRDGQGDGRSPDESEDLTALDAGQWPGAEEPTTLDSHSPSAEAPEPAATPGRGGDWGESRLPPDLEVRFRYIEELTGHGAEAVLYLVREAASGQLRVVKLYRPNWQRDEQVRDWLLLVSRDDAQPPVRNVVKFFEADRTWGRAYEVMEYLPDGDLYRLPEITPKRIDPGLLAEMVRQVAPVLHRAHEDGIVHRDVKPGNILMRAAAPLDVALVDFGISSYVGPGRERINETRSMTFRYAAPEWLASSSLSASVDWWALGMTVAELAGGCHPFEDWTERQIMDHLAVGRSVNMTMVDDPRLDLLCRGLLTKDPADRWGYAQVDEWCRGGSPAVRDRMPAEDEEPLEGDTRVPFSYQGVAYLTPVELAVTLAKDWEVAVGHFFPADRKAGRMRRAALRDWLATLDDAEHDEASRAELRKQLADERLPANFRLFRLLRWLYPRLEPIYRTVTITASSLPGQAWQAIDGYGVESPVGVSGIQDIIADLWDLRLLPELAAAPGGTGLAEIDRRWRALRLSWDGFAGNEHDEHVRRLLAHVPEDILVCYLLWLASARDGAVRDLRTAASDARARLVTDLPWFSRLTSPVAGTLSLLAAVLLAGLAEEEARRVVEQRLAERQARRRRLREKVLDDWRNRVNRPVALGFAGAGVALVAAFWIWLIGLSDLLPFASNEAVDQAWLCSILSIVAFGAAEIWLAAVIGGNYHPRGYSLISAGLSRAGRALRPVQRQGGLLLVIFVTGFAALIAVTSYLPYVLPLTCTVGEFFWVRSRYRRWQADERALADESRLAVAELRADRRSAATLAPVTDSARSAS